MNHPLPSESEEQAALFRWAAMAQKIHPELELLHHIPNGGLRSKSTAARLKREGVKSGVPDLCLPVPKGPYHGLYIEMKRKGNAPTPNQKHWLRALGHQGYHIAVCYSWQEGKDVIIQYLTAKKA